MFFFVTRSFLAGPTRREWGKFHPQYTNVKVEGPSFPTVHPTALGMENGGPRMESMYGPY